MNELNAALLRSLLKYDPETGVFTWAARAGHNGKIPAGTVAGSVSSSGRYRQIRINKRLYQAHRLAWAYVYGSWPLHDIDHINGRPADNRIANLRDVSTVVNGQNQTKAHSRSVSGLLGVSWDTGRQLWRAAISVNRHGKFLGHFLTPQEAHQAYLKAKRKLHEGCTI